LFVVRHAEAAPGEPDAQRRLTKSGRATAKALGKKLAKEHPDAVISSPLSRARETAEAIASAAGVTVETDERLAPGATADALRDAVRGRGETVVTVGHQPDCGEIVLALAGYQPAFPPGGVAEVEL
jgi:phosphohistidine phosphatase SixA